MRLLLLSPTPMARYRVWINGRPFGGGSGFALPPIQPGGPAPDNHRTSDRGRILEKGQVLEKGRVLEKGDNHDKSR